MLVFPKEALLEFDGNLVTDHSRSPLDISIERIGRQVRTANGTLRKYHVADKRTFSVSWEMLPSTSHTVDGGWGWNDINDFYNNTVGSFELGIVKRDGERSLYTVVFTDFGRTLNKRWDNSDYYDVSITMEQV